MPFRARPVSMQADVHTPAHSAGSSNHFQGGPDGELVYPGWQYIQSHVLLA